MKNILYTLALSFITSTTLVGQAGKIEVNEVLHENTLRSSVEIEMMAEENEVKKAWKDYIEDNYNVDVEGYGLFSKKDVLSVTAGTIRSISDQNLDLYAKIVPDGQMTKMNVYGAYGYDAFWTPTDNPEEFQAMQKVVRGFVASFLPNYFAEVVDDARDDVKDAKDDVSKLENKIEKNKDKIASLTKENIDLVNELAEAREKLAKTKKELTKDKDKLETVKDKVSKSGSDLK